MLDGLDPVSSGILLYGVLLISLVWHEAAHALVAMWMGDKTAYLGGQVTLNPIPHMRREPFGTLILPLAILYMTAGRGIMGFAHVPIDAFWAERNPRRAALVSFAGPLSNFVLVLLNLVILLILVKAEVLRVTYGLDIVTVDGSEEGIAWASSLIIWTFMLLNLLLGLLNLIPLPPLDGASVVGGLFPRSAGRFYAWFNSNPINVMISFALLFFVFFDYLYMATGASLRFLLELLQ